MLRTDGSIQIGGDISGISSAIDDPTGWIWTTLRLIDGRRTPDEIIAASGRSAADVVDLLDVLHDAGYLEDSQAQESRVLSAAERDRYSRNQHFYRWIDLAPRPSAWTPQEQLKSASVVVLGLGGGGSSAALALAGSGVGHLHCVDFDHVELSNLARQFLYCEADVGRSKVDAAVLRLRAINSDIRVTGEELRIESEHDLVRLTASADVLALCADLPEDLPQWTARACARTSTPWVLGGYLGPTVEAMSFSPTGGACFECLHLDGSERSVDGPGAKDETGVPSNADIAASNGALAGLGGSLLAHLAMAHITGAPRYERNFSMGLNVMAPGELLHRAPEPRPDCPLCGGTGIPDHADDQGGETWRARRARS